VKIELTQYQENPDGSADFHVDMDKEASHSLLNYGLLKMLTEAVEAGKLYSPEFNKEEEEADPNYYYDEEEGVEWYFVEEEDTWYYYDEEEEDWVAEEEETYAYTDPEAASDKHVWVSLTTEQLDEIIVEELKNTYRNTYTFTWSMQEDMDNNLAVREACKTLLNYYMVSKDAEMFFLIVDGYYGS